MFRTAVLSALSISLPALIAASPLAAQQIPPSYATWLPHAWDHAVLPSGDILVLGMVGQPFPPSWVTGAVVPPGADPAAAADTFLMRVSTTAQTPIAVTLIGGGDATSFLWDMAVEADGSAVHVTGTTSSRDLPITNGTGALLDGSQRAVVLSFDSVDLSLRSSAVVPGLSGGESIAVHPSLGLVVGGTRRDDGTGLYRSWGPGGGVDAAVAALAPTTGLLTAGWSIGGIGLETCESVVVDGAGRIHVGGRTEQSSTWSTGELLPTTPTAFRAGPSAPASVRGNRTSSAMDRDLFVITLDAGLQTVEFASLFGGSDEELGSSWDGACLAAQGDRLALFGRSRSSDVRPAPTTGSGPAGDEDGWVVVIDFGTPGASQPVLLASLLLGGSGRDRVVAAAFDPAGRVHVGGGTTPGSGGKKRDRDSATFPVVDNGSGLLKSTLGDDGFYAVIDPASPAPLLYSSLIGTDAADVVVQVRPTPGDGVLLVLQTGGSLLTTAAALYPSRVTTADHWLGLYGPIVR